MAEYRVPEFTLEQRAEAALQMLVPWLDRQWGLVSELARLYGVSLTILYELRERTWEAIVEPLLAGEAGQPAQVTTLTVNKAFIDRTIAILPILKGSVRDIRQGLALILGVTRSVGYVSQTLAAAGEQATVYNLGVRLPLPILGGLMMPTVKRPGPVPAPLVICTHGWLALAVQVGVPTPLYPTVTVCAGVTLASAPLAPALVAPNRSVEGLTVRSAQMTRRR